MRIVTNFLLVLVAGALVTSVNAAGAATEIKNRKGQKALAAAAKPTETAELSAKYLEKKRLNRKERKEVLNAEKAVYIQKRSAGTDEVSNTPDSVALRNYKLRNKKQKGLFRKREASLAEVLFPGVAPEDYTDNIAVAVFADLVESRKNPVPYEYYDLPYCSLPEENKNKKLHHKRENFGSRLQGHNAKVAPFDFRVKVNKGCTIMCGTSMDTKTISWMRKLVKAQYRVQLTLDRLPVLMRSKEYNYAVRGYPVGFIALESFTALTTGAYYLFNHLKFVITYNQLANGGINVVGFDVHPMSVNHKDEKNESTLTSRSLLPTCDGSPVTSDPSQFVMLEQKASVLSVIYSYEVEWVSSELLWADRWDVYLIGAPDDDIRYFSILNSLVTILFMAGAIGIQVIRTLRNDIAEIDALDNGVEEAGWKLLHGDVFRPPQTMPMALAVLVGTGAHVCTAFGLTMLSAVLKLFNPMQRGQTLTAWLVLYALCGSVGGYVSSRLYKFTDQKAWKLNIVMTATALPGFFVVLFMALNIWLTFAGAATAVSFFTIVRLFFLWMCVSAPHAFVGGALGFQAPKIKVPTPTNEIALVVAPTPCRVQPLCTIFMGGILPFGAVTVELAFVLASLWLHQWYYNMGFLLAMMVVLVVMCAQVSIILTYMRLRAGDHDWWWTSFLQTASAGVYLFLQSMWFLIADSTWMGCCLWWFI